MSSKNFLAALAEGIVEEMRRDPSVFVMGQDIRYGLYGAYPVEEFGERVRDVPISEAANVGTTIGAAMTGMRPVLDMTISTFLYSAMDQIVNQAAKSRHLFGGQAKLPLVIRSSMFYGGSQAAHHNDRNYGMFMGVPGLKIMVPSTAADAKGLIKTAVREDDPVLSFEDANLWGSRSQIPDGDVAIPFGVADVKREGTDVTIVALANCVRMSLDVARELEAEGISVEVIDPRTIVPLDWDAIFASVEKTRRLVIVDPAPLSCSVASEISATASETLSSNLARPPIRVTAADVHVPFSPPLERAVLPSRERISAAVRAALQAEVARTA